MVTNVDPLQTCEHCILFAYERGMEKNRCFAEVCAKLKWPPPWHLPSTAIDQIVSAYNWGSLSAEETVAVFASYYTPERVTEIGHRWAAYTWLSDHLPILQEALADHLDGRYYSAVCVLIPQIEGILREMLRKKPTQQNSVTVLRNSELGNAAGRFFTEVFWASFWPGTNTPIPELSRHAVLHGIARDFGTPAHSLRVILIADIIVSSLEEKRSGSSEGVPKSIPGSWRATVARPCTGSSPEDRHVVAAP